MNEYGKIIARFRNDMGLTQKELGDRLGVSAKAVGAWENGRNEPNMGTIKKMADIFSCSVSDIMGVTEMSADSHELISVIKKYTDADELTKQMVKKLLDI